MREIKKEKRKKERKKIITKPPAADYSNISIFPEILSQFSLANAQKKALTDEITKMCLLTFFAKSTGLWKNDKSLEICRKIDYGLKSFQAGIHSIRPRSPSSTGTFNMPTSYQ